MHPIDNRSTGQAAIVAAWICAALVMTGAAQAPQLTSVWHRIRYPPVTIPGTAHDNLTFLVSACCHTKGPHDEPSHLRLDAMWSARDATAKPPANIADAATVVVKLHTADGKVVTPQSAPAWVGIANAGSTTWFLISMFPWSRNALDEAWFEVRAAGQTWWIELPYGFARNPKDVEIPDRDRNEPRFPATMQPLGAGDILVPWLDVEYEVGRIANGALLSTTLSNPAEPRASIVVDRPSPVQVGPDTSRQNLDTPRVAVDIAADGRTFTGHELARGLSENRRRRTGDFSFAGTSLRGRTFGTARITVDGQRYDVRVPSSVFAYAHGRTDPENPHWMSAGAIPQPSAVAASVVVRLPNGKTTYRMGEEIPLDVVFRGTGDKDYFFGTGRCGFLTRWRTEQLIVTPSDGTTDPLADFFNSLGGFGFSCPGSWQALDDTPLTIPMSLNDHVRFSTPGTYRVVVSSTRLERYSREPAPVLVSAPVDLTILPMDKAWAAAEVARAAALIDQRDPSDVRHGAALLRYLQTPAAARLLVDRYDTIATVDQNEATAGLVSSSDRAAIVHQMERRVDAGGTLQASFLDTVTRLRVLIDLPPTPVNARARLERERIVRAEYEGRWHAAMARHPMTAGMLGAELARLEAAISADGEFQRQVARDLEQHPAQAVEAFAALPAETQWLLLQSATAWPYIGRAWIVPALRQVYAAWHGRPTTGRVSLAAGDGALARLYELAPDEGRQAILEEIRTGEHGISYDTLAILPDTELPELNSALESRYSAPRKATPQDSLAERGTTAWLVARYGSATLLPFVSAAIARPLAGCFVEGGLLAYLLKHDPEAAVKRLDPAFNRTGGRICVMPLDAVASHYWDDRVESAAIATLMTTDIGRVSEAAQLLGSHGSREAKQPLLDRLAAWSAEWRGRAAELASHGPGLAWPPETIENNVVNALFGNGRLDLTKDDVRRIRALCVTDQCRSQVTRHMGAGEAPQS